MLVGVDTVDTGSSRCTCIGVLLLVELMQAFLRELGPKPLLCRITAAREFPVLRVKPVPKTSKAILDLMLKMLFIFIFLLQNHPNDTK